MFSKGYFPKNKSEQIKYFYRFLRGRIKLRGGAKFSACMLVKLLIKLTLANIPVMGSQYKALAF